MDKPRALKHEEISKFFQHIAERQGSLGAKEAFRFKVVKQQRKGTATIPAIYADSSIRAGPIETGADAESDADRPRRTQKKRKEKDKRKGNPTARDI